MQFRNNCNKTEKMLLVLITINRLQMNWISAVNNPDEANMQSSK